jgi:two-component sensor histidine kinase
MLSMVVGAMVFLALRDMNREAERSRTYAEIRGRTNALNVTAARFQNRPDAGAVHQIRDLHASLTALIQTMTFLDADEEYLVRQIQANTRDLEYSIEKLIANVIAPPTASQRQQERYTVLASHLWMKTQFISDDSRRLTTISQMRVAHARRYAALLTLSSVAALMLINAAISYATGRHLIRVQAGLRASEERLRASLEEKEVLLKEIHHRVKNNMQVISSLMALQAEQMPDTALGEVLREVTHRVRSMALVHEKLYQSGDLARVDFADYTRDLLNYLWRAHGQSAAGIHLSLDLAPVMLPVNAAVPCGLILNELAGNALKHAFNGRNDGQVKVSLGPDSDGRVRLAVRDNGIGLASDFDWRQGRSLGLRLVQMLAGQLHAAVAVSRDGGTEFTINFAGALHEHPKHHPDR